MGRNRGAAEEQKKQMESLDRDSRDEKAKDGSARNFSLRLDEPGKEMENKLGFF